MGSRRVTLGATNARRAKSGFAVSAPINGKGTGAGKRASTRASAFLTAAASIVAIATIATPRLAHAELQLDGRWRQGALSEDFTVQQWLPGCGPEPQTSRTGGGEIVAIRLEGDELAIVGGGRVYRSNTCYDPMPNLSRETHSRDPSGKTWRTRCTTPANDPRKAILNTLVVATTDKRIDIVETGRYEITLETGRCIADVKRTRSYDLVEDEKPAPATAPTNTAKEPKPEPKPTACDAPGEPSRLEVRPSRKLLRTGESFAFRPLVLDEKGCSTRTSTNWQVAPGSEGKGVSVDKDGKVTVAGDAPEGAVELLVTAAGKSTRVVIDVTQPAHYDDLLARSGLNASGENDAASVVSIGTQSIGAGEGRVEDRAKARRFVFIGIVGAVLVVLGALAVVLLRRSRRAAALEQEAVGRHEERLRDAMERRKRREEAHASQQRAHEKSVADAQAAAEAQRMRAAAAAVPKPTPQPELTCPTCSRTWNDGTTFCPHDGVALVAKAGAAPPAGVAGAPARRGKICPTCGDRFDGAAEFCGKDGTQLVLIN